MAAPVPSWDIPVGRVWKPARSIFMRLPEVLWIYFQIPGDGIFPSHGDGLSMILRLSMAATTKKTRRDAIQELNIA
jgi:hypothetical protein